MNFLDVRTVIFSQLITDIVCVLVLALLWQQNRRRFAGASFWVLDFCFQAGATLLIILRGSVPDWMSTVLSNSLVIAGALLGYMGLERFVGKKSSQVHNYIVLLVFAGVHSYFLFVQPNLGARTLNVSLALLIICCQCAWLMWRRVEPSMRQMSWGIGLVFGIFSLVSLVRIVVVLASPQPSNDFFQSGTFDTLILLSYQMLLILLAYGLTLMGNRRLLADLQVQEEKFGKAFRLSPYAITLTQLSDGRMREVNDSFVTFSGYSRAETIGKTTPELHLWVSEDDRAAVISALSKNKRVLGKEFQFRNKSGETRTGIFSAEVILLNNQPWVLSNITDITERKQTEEAWGKIAERLDLATRSAQLGIWDWDIQKNKLVWDDQMFKLYGIAQEQFPGAYEAWLNGVHPEDRVHSDEISQKAVNGKVEYDTEFRVAWPNGSVHWLKAVGQIFRDENGQAIRMVGVNYDITERKQAEEMLREYSQRLEREVKQRTQELEHELAERQVADQARRQSEAYVRNIFDSSLDMIVTVDNDRRIVEFNRAAQETFGYTLDQVIGKHINILYANEEASQITYQATLAHNTFVGEVANKRKNGEIFYSLLSSAVMHDAQGKPMGLVGVSRDITERHQIEQALRASEGKFRSIVEVSHDGISLCEEQGNVIEWNSGAEEITGLSRAQVLGRPIWEVQFQMVPPENQTPGAYEIIRVANQQLLATGNLPSVGKRQEREICRTDGTHRTVSTIISPIQTPRGYMISSTSRDITERKQMEMVLLRAKEELEQRVQERTNELRQANAQLQAEITERWQAQIALADETERLTLTLRSIGDAVITTDRDERIVLFNPIAEQLTGWNNIEAIGQPLSNVFCLVNAQTHQPLANPLTQVLQTGVRAGLQPDTVLASKDGQEYMLSASFAPIRDKIGATTGVALVFRDISLIRQAEHALQDTRAAETANRAKTQFLAHMSHEIRTPIHGITGLTALLSNTELNPEQQEYLTMIKSSADVLLDTVNDILDFSKIEAGKFDLEQIEFDLISVVERAIDQPAIHARKKGVELICQIAPDVPAQFIGAGMRLRQILVNLIGNAVKFTEQGEIIVAVEKPAETQLLHFTVRDTGIGITAEKQQIIFEAFRQSDDTTARHYGGTGLGLAISQKLVELMNGRIWVESEVGQGSTFHFTVELQPKLQVTAALCPDPAWCDVPVLVIDDNDSSRTMLSQVLSSWGMRVTETVNACAGLQAIEIAREQNLPFRLILLDSVMPKTDGFKTVEWFRDDAYVRQSVVMLLASDDVHSELARCHAQGIGFHLIKPIKPSDLYRVVKSVLSPPVEQPRPSNPVALVSPSDRVATPARILFVEDNVVNQMVGKKLLEQNGFVVQLARNGKQALSQLETDTFDLILMDIEMPEMDGFEATRTIRHAELGSGKHIPIIAMTAYGSQENRELCLQAGMDSYLAKPFTPAKLDDAMMPFVQSVSAPAPIDVLRIDRNVALDAVGGSEEFLHEAIQAFIAEDYVRHDTDIAKGLEQKDAEVIRRAAHGLKGALSSFGGLAACELAHQIELAAKANDLPLIQELRDQLQMAVQEFAEFFGLRLEN